jgi:Transposase IS66 family
LYPLHRARAHNALFLFAASVVDFLGELSSVGGGERLHGDDTTVPILAKGKTVTGRIWTYVRDDRPFGGPAPPAAGVYASPDRRGEHPGRHLQRFGGSPGRRLWRLQCALRFRPLANAAERSLRGLALGRKAWLFAGSDCGADRTAVTLTLIMKDRLDIDPMAGWRTLSLTSPRFPEPPAPTAGLDLQAEVARPAAAQAA